MSTITKSDAQPIANKPAVEPGTPVAIKKPFEPIRVIGPLVVFGLFIGLWYVGRMLLSENKRFLVPPLHHIFTKALPNPKVRAEIVESTWLDIKVAVLGLSIAIVLGVAIAIVMSMKEWLEISFWPYLVALQAIPILTVAPLIGAILGYGMTPRVFVTVVISIFPIISNTLFGITGIDRSFHDLFSLHGTSRWTRLVKLQLPAASPAIFAGFRISAGLAVIGAIVGDVFFRAGKAGLGQLVDVYVSRLRGPEIWLVIFMAAALGLVFFAFFAALNSVVVGRWNDAKN
jgi:NitT/TauT family transport system permease protein